MAKVATGFPCEADMRTLLCILPFTALLLAGCGNADNAPATAEQAPAGKTAAPATNPASSPAPADVATRYACDPDTVVDVLEGGQAARATLPDGTRVDLGKVEGSDPPVYRGLNLFFTIGDGQAHLSQESGRELACRPQ